MSELLPRVVVVTSELNLLHVHALDRRSGELQPTCSVELAEQVHYAVADARSQFLYVSASNGSTNHWLYAFAIDPEDGALTEHGAPLAPPAGRIIHLSIDTAGGYLILAHNQTSQISTLRLAADGTLAELVTQHGPTSTGFYAHQALLDHERAHLVACGLGAPASDTAPEQPGSLTVFDYRAGLLSQTQRILPGPGLGPRHLDYSGGHVFVAIERGNRLFVYNYVDGVLDPEPSFDVSTLRDPDDALSGQRVGAIHVHPNGRYLYLSNRARETTRSDVGGQPVDVFAGGENHIALYEIDRGSGAPQLIARYDTHGFEARTFSIDPAGQFLFVGNQSTRNLLHADGTVEPVSRNVAVFRIGHQARLTYLRKYDFSGGEVFWVGAVALPMRI
jgi:6-phosphogluconolactonase (cycloisomerase 2 family)